MSDRKKRSVALIILDGWGFREETVGNAIRLANTPNWNEIWSHQSRTLLTASGRAVGLPAGQMGNSEVGHLNLGAGRVVMQDLVRIGASIEDGSFFDSDVLVSACRAARERQTVLHLVGLLGDGGVHAHDDHLFALVELAKREGVGKVVIHGMLDGRDTSPTSGLAFLQAVIKRVDGDATFGSISGRYYGMDRDHRWERTEAWYRAAVNGTGNSTHDPVEYVKQQYAEGITDEFIKPAVIVNAVNKPVAPMHDGGRRDLLQFPV